MIKFKVGDRVKIGNTFPRSGQIGNIIKLYDDGAAVKFDDVEGGLYYGLCVLEPIPEQKPKTKTVRKYAVVMEFGNGSISTLADKYTEVEILDFNEQYNYHIIPTIFEDVEVPVKTETRWKFICKGHLDDYYPTDAKYATLEQAKSRTHGEAIQKIDDSAEEFEIE